MLLHFYCVFTQFRCRVDAFYIARSYVDLLDRDLYRGLHLAEVQVAGRDVGIPSDRAADDAASRARIRAEAIDRANVLNGAPVEGSETEALFRRYFAWQRGLPKESEDRKADSTLKESEKSEAPRLLAVFGKMSPAAI